MFRRVWDRGVRLTVLGVIMTIGQSWPLRAQSIDASDASALGRPDSMAQVNSVDQLSDVSPTDWSRSALDSLTTLYNCIQGYPDGTFRGNQAVSRNELAVALDACLESLSDRTASADELAATKARLEEILTLANSLKDVVDSVESRTDTLEAQQFSTTTKLQGQVVLAPQFGVTTQTPAIVPRPTTGPEVPNPVVNPAARGLPGIEAPDLGESRGTAIARVRLSFNTSFSGKDLLNTVLETGNGGQDFFSAAGLNGPANSFPVPPGIGTNNRPPLVDLGTIDYAGVEREVRLYRLAYTFEPLSDVSLTVGSNIYPSDFIDFNSYANDEAQDFSSGFFINNPLIVTNTVDGPGGAGVAVDWGINQQLSLRGLFIAASPTNPTGEDDGLFSAPFQISTELEYGDNFGRNDRNNYAVRLQYTRSAARNSAVVQNVVGLNAEATFGRFGVFGRYGISINPRQGGDGLPNAGLFEFVPGVDNKANIQTWMAGAGYKDLVFDGSLLAVAVGQPFNVNTALENYSPQTNFELFYRFPVNENLTLTPTLMYITNPLNLDVADADNSILQGLLRATFSF